jgi:hypothetical protein
MKNDLRKELNEMKFLFGYKPGKVISEQHIPEMDDELDVMMAEPGVAEPEVKPDTDTDTEKRRTFDPSRRERDPNRLPYEDPDTHPQGRFKRDIELDTPDFEYELEIDDEPEFGNFSDEENEPFIEDVDSDYENSDLADLVNKYLNKVK